jgi:hypothetical protein
VIAARTVERGRNPEDGTGKGLATLAHHGDGSAAAAAKRGTRRSVFEGAGNPGEADPEPMKRFGPLRWEERRKGAGGTNANEL